MNEIGLIQPRYRASGDRATRFNVTMPTGEVVVALANLERKGLRVFGYSARRSVYDPWKAACKKAGIPYVPPHQVGRHSFATEMIVRAGIDVGTTKRLGRWKSTRMLMYRYVHGRDDLATVEAVFGKKNTK